MQGIIEKTFEAAPIAREGTSSPTKIHISIRVEGGNADYAGRKQSNATRRRKLAKRYDICAPRKGKDDKTFWHRVGTAWEGDKGIQLVFDSLPIPDAEGRCVANLFEPRDNSGGDRRKSADADRSNARDRAGSWGEDPPF